MTDMIRLLIVDDHEIVRHGLCMIMGTFDEIEVVGEARNGQEAVECCERLRPDVVLMDLVMPIMDGVTATQIIRQRFASIRIVILTSGTDPDMVSAALAAGAHSYLEKRVNIDGLIEAVKSAVA